MNKNIQICILSAGMGSRMKSNKPKALHQIAGKPMLSHLIDTATLLKPTKIHIVIGNGAEQIQAAFKASDINWVMQSEQLGTGHAVIQAVPDFDKDARVIILVGDAPLVPITTLQALIETECDLGVLTVDHPNPFNYGRIIKQGEQLVRIVEERDTTDTEKLIREINTGIMVAKASMLTAWLSELTTDNDQGEYLLTDIVEIANKQGCTVRAIKTDDPGEVQGVNNFAQLADLEAYYQRRAAMALISEGVHIVDPNRFNLRGQLETGKDVSIDINCIFEGEVTLGNNVKIGANCIVKDSTIGDGCELKPNTMIDGAVLESNCAVGPYARIRPGTHLQDGVAIGNFVETKKAALGKGTKASHLTYLGDTTIGAGVNIGAGTITCNYDGVNKHHTHIEDDVFIGSNSALVAPVTIGKGSTVAAGSTITKLVEEHSLGIARGRQKNLADWKGPKDQ